MSRGVQQWWDDAYTCARHKPTWKRFRDSPPHAVRILYVKHSLEVSLSVRFHVFFLLFAEETMSGV